MSEKNLPAKTQVQQGNDVIKAFYKMDAEQTNLFYYALTKIEQVFDPIKCLENPNGTVFDFNDFKAQFSLSEMFKALDLPDTKNMRDLYFSKFIDLLNTKIKITEVNSKKFYPLYSEATVGLDSKQRYASEICIIFNPLLFRNIFSSRYTNGQLKVLGQLSRGSRNNYAQRLYFYLAMYRNTQGKKRYHNENESEWEVKMTEQYFRELVQMPKNQNTRKDSFRRTIKTAVSKINEKNFEFITSVEFGGYGSDEMIFTCNENMNLYKLGKTDTYQNRIEKLESNKQEEAIAYCKKKYADEWQEEMQKKIKTEPKFLFKMSKDFEQKALDYEVYKIISERHNLN